MLGMMLSATVPNASSGYKYKPFVMVNPIQGPKLTCGISPENHGLRDASFPSSPEVDDNEVPCVSCFLEHNTREIIADFYGRYTSHSYRCGRHNMVLQTMDRVVDSLLVKHDFVYKGMNLGENGDDVSMISSVAEDMFSDCITNWGRITSLLAFGAVVARFKKDTGEEHCVSQVAEHISSYLLGHQKEWLLKNNSWDGFVEYFRVPDPESSVRSALTTIVTVAGIGAILAWLTSLFK